MTTQRKPVLIKRGTKPAEKAQPAPRKLSERELREQWQRERAAKQPQGGKQAFAALWR